MLAVTPFLAQREAVSPSMTVAAKTIVLQGGDSWFFLTADFAFGHAMQRDASMMRVARPANPQPRASNERKPA